MSVQAETAVPVPKPSKRNRKVRAAWISFAGRIVAQMVGAAATVLFAVVVFHAPSTSAKTEPTTTRAASRQGPPARDGVAVLPFVTLSDQGGHQYLAESLTQYLAAALASSRELRVASATAAGYYKGSATTLGDLGAALGVRYVIEGTATIVGGHTRVTVALTDTSNDEVVWAQNYEDSLSDVLAFESRLTDSVAAEVQRVVGGAAALASNGPAAEPGTRR